ncbi:hypothetical protein MYX77_05810 [Acidobacteriia bacterium AH_259_A11_L15]|nr:hypothetical protein [Acidobacteriia bacterium AH_259_A11_L15]
MKTIYLVPHTHYDVVWAFEREDYLYINTFILKKAMEMIRECGFKFLIEQTYPIEQIEQTDPQFFAELREAIRAEKVELVDGQYVMADPMTPAGEVLVREFLFGNLYAEAKLGVEIPVAWAADGFGLNAQLPQIYRKCGFRWLVFRRGLPRSIGYRVSEFLWEGLDGSKIVAHWLPLGYRAGLELDKWDETVQHLASLATTSHILLPCGSGGVPPQEDTPDRVKQWNREHSDSKMVVATPQEFFQSFDKEKKNLTTYRGELYSADLENIFPDAVSSRIRLKLAIKGAEGNLLLAEKLAGLACLYGKPYPAESMTELWKKQLFLAHHDVSPGTGIDQIYEEAWGYINDIKLETRALTHDSVHHLARAKEKSQGREIIVVNTNNWEVTDWVEAEVQFAAGFAHELAVSFNGRELPTEVIDPARDAHGRLTHCKLGFFATAPALGYRVYQVVPKSKDFPTEIRVRDNQVTTPFFRLEVDPQTGIFRVFGLDGSKLVEGNELVIDEEVGDLYFHQSHLKQPIGAEGGGGMKFAAFKPGETTVRQSPLRTTITYRSEFYCLRWPYYLTEKFGTHLYRHKTMDICKQVTVYQDSPPHRPVHHFQHRAVPRARPPALRYLHGGPRLRPPDPVRHDCAPPGAHPGGRRQGAFAHAGHGGGKPARAGLPQQRRSHQRDQGRLGPLHPAAQRVGALGRRGQRAPHSHPRRHAARPPRLHLLAIPLCGRLARSRHPPPGGRVQPSPARLPARSEARRKRTPGPGLGAGQSGRLLPEESGKRRLPRPALLRDQRRKMPRPFALAPAGQSRPHRQPARKGRIGSAPQERPTRARCRPLRNRHLEAPVRLLAAGRNSTLGSRQNSTT